MICLRTLSGCAALLWLCVTGVRADEAVTNLPSSLAAAKQSGKPVFVYVFDSQ